LLYKIIGEIAKKKTTLVLNKGKCDYLNKEDLGLSKDPRSKDKGKIP